MLNPMKRPSATNPNYQIQQKQFTSCQTTKSNTQPDPKTTNTIQDQRVNIRTRKNTLKTIDPKHVKLELAIFADHQSPAMIIHVVRPWDTNVNYVEEETTMKEPA